MDILVLSSHFVQLELCCDTWWKRKTLLSGIQHQVCRHEYNPPPPPHTHRYYMSQNSDHQYFVFFPSYLISCMFLILCMSFCWCQWKLRWKISWQRPVPPHHLLPLADSGISRSILNTGMLLSLNSQPFMPLFQFPCSSFTMLVFLASH